MMLRFAILLLAAAISLPAGIIFSEDFEGGTPVQSQTSGVLQGTQFQVVSGSVDVVGPLTNYASNCGAPTSGTCVDTTGGGSGGLGTIETIEEIELQPGEYILSFDLIGWFYAVDGLTQKATVQVTFGSLFDAVYERNGKLNPYATVNEIITVDTATSAKLVFSTISGSKFAGAILDNVLIRTAAEEDISTPEPSSLALLGLGGLLLALRKRMVRRPN